jgi:hypothetical protein
MCEGAAEAIVQILEELFIVAHGPRSAPTRSAVSESFRPLDLVVHLLVSVVDELWCPHSHARLLKRRGRVG